MIFLPQTYFVVGMPPYMFTQTIMHFLAAGAEQRHPFLLPLLPSGVFYPSRHINYEGGHILLLSARGCERLQAVNDKREGKDPNSFLVFKFTKGLYFVIIQQCQIYKDFEALQVYHLCIYDFAQPIIYSFVILRSTRLDFRFEFWLLNNYVRPQLSYQRLMYHKHPLSARLKRHRNRNIKGHLR